MIATGSSIFGYSLQPRARRRWLVAMLWGVLIPLLCSGFWWITGDLQHRGGGLLNFVCWSVLWIAGLLGGMRAGGWVKPFRPQVVRQRQVQQLFPAPTPTESELVAQELAMDEREALCRDQVLGLSYRVVQVAIYLAFVGYVFLGLWHPELQARTGQVLLFLLTLGTWSLPQSIILWTEPDVE